MKYFWTNTCVQSWTYVCFEFYKKLPLVFEIKKQNDMKLVVVDEGKGLVFFFTKILFVS